MGRYLKELGLACALEGSSEDNRAKEPRLIRRRPRQDFHHPAGCADIRRTLAFVGPIAVYGIKCIELSRSPDTSKGSLPPLGQLIVPGQIRLFEQPLSPWTLKGTLASHEEELIHQAGGQIEVSKGLWATRIFWPEQTLRDFMLFDVLLHEVGHHILQHHKGKRTQRTARQKDHEAFAKLFSLYCRKAWFDLEKDHS